jgi:hypothetical protein
MMDDDKTVVATFSQIDYSVDTDIYPVGAGTVSKNPEEPYHYGDEVSLTATAAPGWTFDSWSGDVISTSNPVQLTIEGNMSITANFTRSEYSLVVGVKGNGQVEKDPDKESYFYGDEVTLTAQADAGWVFQQWNGDIISTTNPVQLSVQSNHVITATFAELHDLTLDQIGSGTVSLDPPGGTYISGTVVLLTPQPDKGWEFDRWEGNDAGDLLDNEDGTWSLVLDSDKTITIRFKYLHFIPFLASSDHSEE